MLGLCGMQLLPLGLLRTHRSAGCCWVVCPLRCDAPATLLISLLQQVAATIHSACCAVAVARQAEDGVHYLAHYQYQSLAGASVSCRGISLFQGQGQRAAPANKTQRHPHNRFPSTPCLGGAPAHLLWCCALVLLPGCACLCLCCCFICCLLCCCCCIFLCFLLARICLCLALCCKLCLLLLVLLALDFRLVFKLFALSCSSRGKGSTGRDSAQKCWLSSAYCWPACM